MFSQVSFLLSTGGSAWGSASRGVCLGGSASRGGLSGGGALHPGGLGRPPQSDTMGSGRSKGGREGYMTPPRSKFFQFHTVFGKFSQNHMLAPPPHPPRGNPGSATDGIRLTSGRYASYWNAFLYLIQVCGSAETFQMLFMQTNSLLFCLWIFT